MQFSVTCWRPKRASSRPAPSRTESPANGSSRPVRVRLAFRLPCVCRLRTAAKSTANPPLREEHIRLRVASEHTVLSAEASARVPGLCVGRACVWRKRRAHVADTAATKGCCLKNPRLSSSTTLDINARAFFRWILRGAAKPSGRQSHTVVDLAGHAE